MSLFLTTVVLLACVWYLHGLERVSEVGVEYNTSQQEVLGTIDERPFVVRLYIIEISNYGGLYSVIYHE